MGSDNRGKEAQCVQYPLNIPIPPSPPPVLFQFNHFPGQKLFLCRCCNAQIAAMEDFIARDKILDLFIVRNVVNAIISRQEHFLLEISRIKVKDLRCIRCSSLLGWKFIDEALPHRLVREGRFLLNLCKVSFWDGYMMIDAVTGKPMPPLPPLPPLPPRSVN